MASKKLKRAATIAAGIGAAYLASQALNKKKPLTKSSLARRKGDTFGADTAQAYQASKPKDTFGSDMAATYENVPGSKFLTTPGGFSRMSPATPEQVNEQMDAFGPMAKKGKFIVKKAMGGVFAVKDLFERSQTARDIGSHLGLAPRLLSDRYNEKEREKREAAEAQEQKKTMSLRQGGSVVARGNKFARSKPTKLF